MTPEEMIKKFLCPGCVSGEDCLDIQLIKFNDEQTGFNCLNYCAGTRILGLGKIFLSMPKGFNRVGNNPAVEVRLFLEGNKPIWDNLNVPVWAALV